MSCAGPVAKVSPEPLCSPGNWKKIDCEQSLSFFTFSKGSARARACVSRAFCSTDQEKRETTRSLGRRVHEQCAARSPAAGIPVSQYNVEFN